MIATDMNATKQKQTGTHEASGHGSGRAATFPGVGCARPIPVLCCPGGYTLIDLTMTVALLGVLIAIAIPHANQQRVQIINTQRLAIASLRLARANAISKNVHFQVAFPDSRQIRVSRMVENPVGSGTWQVDTTSVQTTPLPAPTSFPSRLIGTSIEFNSRGFVVNLNVPLRIDAQDTFGVTKSLQVWPSGQIYEL